MSLSRKEIKTSALDTTRQENSQIGDLVNEFINLTISEINHPGWAFPRENYNHVWSWLRRKTSFSTVASTTDYVLGREIDKVALVRQTATPDRLVQLNDNEFFDFDADPTDTGNPRSYRQWEIEGVSTRLDTADTIDVVSSSTSDAGSGELAVSVLGFVAGLLRTETYQLNGTSTVSGALTFQARELYVSKQKDTTGVITVKENSGGTTLVTLGPKERSAKFKVISLYPIPSSAITMYVQYYTTIPLLYNDSDVCIIPNQFHYVIRMGAITKIFQYLNKEQDALTMQASYAAAVKAMVAADKTEPDIVEGISSTRRSTPIFYQKRSDAAVS